MKVPRLRTLESIEAEIKKADADSAVSIYLLRETVRQNAFCGCMVGQKFIVNMDELLRFFKSREVPPCSAE